MVAQIAQNHDAIRELCARFRVERLEIFGSALDEECFDPQKSDFDFLVSFLSLEPGEHADAYFGLLEALQSLFGREVDLVMTSAIRNPYFLEKVNQNRILLYAA